MLTKPELIMFNPELVFSDLGVYKKTWSLQDNLEFLRKLKVLLVAEA